jgi:hypothetical protein
MAVTASVTSGTVFGAPRRLAEVPLEQVPFSTFATFLNATFQVQRDSRSSVGLQLVEVNSTAPSPAQLPGAEDAANEKFSLLFSGPLKQPLEQDSYWFECQGVGRFLMFIVPIGSTETTHCYYEAIFNRPATGLLPQARQVSIPLRRAQDKRRRPQP